MQVRPSKADRWSLASRLTLWYSLSAFVLLSVLAVVLDWGLSRSLESEAAMLAERERQELARILTTSPLDFGEVREEVERDQNENAQPRVWVRVISLSGGTERVESRGMSGLGMDVESGPLANVASGPWTKGSTLKLPSQTAVRAFSTTATRADGRSYGIQVYVDATRLDRIERDYRRRAGVLLGFAFLGFSVVGYAIARRGLAPLVRIAATMADIGSTTMDRRVDPSGLSSELWTLGTAFNEVLERLDEAFARLERSAADIAHELRTPLTRMRLAAEVALNSSHGAEQYRDALRTCLEEASELTQLIERVLFLARADEPFGTEQGEMIDLAAEVRQVTDFYDAPAAESGLTIATQTSSSLWVRGDRGLLLRAISNLIENSISHTPSGGTVELCGSRRDGAVEISVRDTGCGIPANQLSRVFEPFARVDVARSSESGGAGLGLAIVRKVVVLHGGTVSATSKMGAGTTVTICLPPAIRT